MMMLNIDIISSFRKSTFSPLQQLQIPRNLNVLKHGKKQVMCCSQTHNNMTSLELSRSGRRQAVCQIVALFSALPCMVPPAWAAESEAEGDYELYKDETDKFSLLVPQDWIKGKGKADGQRMVTAFFPENDEVSNVNVIITGLGADYTRMESFGPVDAFAETLVNSLDRSWKRPPGQAAKLLNAKSKNGMYYVEYSLQKPGESKIHLFSTVGMAFGDWYNRLYTVTGQFLEEDADKYKAKIEKIQIQANKVALEVDHLQTLLLHWGKPHVMLLECLRLLLGATRLLPVVSDTASLSVVLSTMLAAPRARCINEVTHQLATTFINSLAWMGLTTSSAWVGLSSCHYCTS